MIEFRNVSYSYPNDAGENLRNIDLQIGSGEFIVVTGKSGCGKTTLAKCINGLIPYFHEGELVGDVLIDGANTKQMELHEIGAKVGSVFQDPRAQFFTTNTTDEVAFGCQNIGLARDVIFARVDEAFSALRIEDLRDQSIFHISSGEKQKIAIASCRAMRPCIYLLDEPSSNLDIGAIGRLAKILGRLKQAGHTVVVMEHRLYYLRGLVDRIIYMEKGEIVQSFTSGQFGALAEDRLAAMGLRSFDLRLLPFRQHDYPINSGLTLEVRHLAFTYPCRNPRRKRCYQKPPEELLNDTCFLANGGEVIGITGKNGAGKTTLARLLTGLIQEKGGVVLLNGEKIMLQERLGNCYFVMQDSDYQLFEDSVANELKLGNEQVEQIKEKCRMALEMLDLTSYLETHPAALSRGEKQRLTVACAMVSIRFASLFAVMFFLDLLPVSLGGAGFRMMLFTLLYMLQRFTLLAMVGTYIAGTVSASEFVCTLEKLRLPRQVILP
jgi:energy-coupling factor transporter ATP-binding protein EcfA2